MSHCKIVFYRMQNGIEPVKDFLDNLDMKMRAKMVRTIRMLEEYGYELREPCSKPLQDGIFELRAQVGNNITRVLYFFFVGNKAVLTNGFFKKSQKTPTAEIEKAKRYKADYLNRKDDSDD